MDEEIAYAMVRWDGKGFRDVAGEPGAPYWVFDARARHISDRGAIWQSPTTNGVLKVATPQGIKNLMPGDWLVYTSRDHLFVMTHEEVGSRVQELLAAAFAGAK